MWEIEQHLQTDEIVEFVENPAWVCYWPWFLLALLFIWTIFIPALIIFYVALHRESSKCIITNKRVAARIGIVSERFKALPYTHITSVGLRQGIMGKIFNYGDIPVDTSGSGTGIDIVFRCMPDPLKIKKMIDNHIP